MLSDDGQGGDMAMKTLTKSSAARKEAITGCKAEESNANIANNANIESNASIAGKKRMKTPLRSPGARKEAITGYCFTLPFFLLFSLFTVIPVIMSILIGFTNFNLLQMPKFVGMDNYVRLFLEDNIFIKAIGNTLILAAITGPLSYLISFLFAWFINELPPKLRALVTLVFYAPSISGNMFIVWQIFFSGDSRGYLNSILYQLNITTIPIIWLKNPKYLLTIVCIVTLWASLGTSFLAFIAGFQGVDRTYYEAASVDGVKNRWQELWYVTLPLMRPQLMFSAVMSITGSFGIGSIITGLAGFPTVVYSAHTIMHHLEDYAAVRFELGYASAIATVLFLMMLISNKAVQRLLTKVGT